jgi:ankyrin repeat protein
MQSGGTVLHAAASSGHIGIITALLDKGLSHADTDAVRGKPPAFSVHRNLMCSFCSSQSQATPLHWLPSNASAAVVRLFLDRGADINALTLVRYLLTHDGGSGELFTPISFLLAQRKDTPLHYTILRKNFAASSALIKAGAEVNIISVRSGAAALSRSVAET